MQVPADTVIAAVGERIDETLFAGAGAAMEHGRPVVDENMMTQTAGVYAAGDSRRGPATVVEAIADAAKAAAAIAGISYERFADDNAAGTTEAFLEKKGVLCKDLSSQPDQRCLGCQTVCEVCCDVCPNRANAAIKVPGKCTEQVIHIDGMCNECGNCEVFCPYNGRPYKDKFTLFWSEEDMADSENEGFLFMEDGRIKVRLDGSERELALEQADELGADAAQLIRTVQADYSYLMQK